MVPRLSIFWIFIIYEFSEEKKLKKAGTMDCGLKEKRLTYRSYLEMLVDALMMMIPAIPINSGRYE